MSAQQHMILRQVFELHGCSEEAAPRLQAQMRAAYYRHLVPLIERVCSEHSLPGRIDRVDTLEIDVGALDLPEIDEAFAARFASVFARELAAAIVEASQVDSDLELVAHFLATGTLPWWADAGDRTAFDASLARLVGRAPHALRQVLARVIDSERAGTRLAHACSTALLEELVAAWVPALETVYSGWSGLLAAAIEALPSARNHAPRTLRRILREEILRIACAPGAESGNARYLVDAVFARVAYRLGVRVGVLRAELRAYAENGARMEPAWLREFAAELRQGDAEEVAAAPRRQREADARLFGGERAQDAADHAARARQRKRDAESRPVESGLAHDAFENTADTLQRRLEVDAQLFAQFIDELARSAPSPQMGTELRESLRALRKRIPARLQSAAASILDDDATAPIEGRATGRVSIEALAALLSAALGDRLLTPETLERYAALTERSQPGAEDSGSGFGAFARAVLRTARERPQAATPRPTAGWNRAKPEAASAEGLAGSEAPQRQNVSGDNAPGLSLFSDSEQIYVENAGLVILWPFLGNFFARLGLVEDGRFKDAAARQRAVGLLQFIAGADEDPQEYLLPLNKVLCGMAPEDVFDFGAEITAAEIGECDDMLAAVIQQATILREMSIDGFRGSFLLRKGQLGARDGNWLLRVQRETHDIVLDRFPWSVQIVKLPWMEAILQVEW